MDFSGITTPVRVNLLICFLDIQGFSKISEQMQDPGELFDLLNGWAAIIVKEVEAVGGRVVKFIGDACLAVFSEEAADAGTNALLSAKAKAEVHLEKHGFPNKMRVTVHFGEVIVEQCGAGNCKGTDVLGDAVNVCASLGRGDHRGKLILSPQAFRRLEPSSRKLFHKHTPPIVYIAE